MRGTRLRWIVALAVAWAFTFASLVALPARAGTGEDRCRFQRLDAGLWTPRETRRTVACFAGKLGVSVDTALTIAYRESRYRARAYNRTGCGGHGCLGTYQHHALYWPGRLRAADDALRRWDVRKRKWGNPRVAAVVTFVMVRRSGGWGAWSTCC